MCDSAVQHEYRSLTCWTNRHFYIAHLSSPSCPSSCLSLFSSLSSPHLYVFFPFYTSPAFPHILFHFTPSSPLSTLLWTFLFLLFLYVLFFLILSLPHCLHSFISYFLSFVHLLFPFILSSHFSFHSFSFLFLLFLHFFFAFIPSSPLYFHTFTSSFFSFHHLLFHFIPSPSCSSYSFSFL